jgi:homospermidine synthase
MNKRIERAKSLKHLIEFNGKILIIGMGSVGRALLPLLFKLVKLNPEQITVIDMVNISDRIMQYVHKGIIFKHIKITKDNYKQILSKYGNGDFLIDCAWNIDTLDLLKVCASTGIMYINSSIEEWNPYDSSVHVKTQDYTLYDRQMELRDWINSLDSNNLPTMILEHGANPGMVSHLVKKAMIDIAKQIICDPIPQSKKLKIANCIKTGSFNLLAREIGLKVIHISEQDTQITSQPKQPDEFVNTWSTEGFREEAIFAPSELGYGTHEKSYPNDAVLHRKGDRNQICLKSRGMNVMMHSWVKSGHILGMLIRHGEAFSISDRLSVYPENVRNPQNYLVVSRNKNHTEKVLYRPTVHYVYRPCDSALSSIKEIESNNFKIQSSDRIMYNDIISGRDELGCLLLGSFGKSRKQGWWIGSLLNIDEARKLVDPRKNDINATSIQVASSYMGAIIYAMKNPNKGVLLPDDIDYKEILKVAIPFWGQMYSGWVDVDWKRISDMQFESFRQKEENVV